MSNAALDYGTRLEAQAKISAKERLAFIRSFVHLPDAIGTPDATKLAPNQIFAISGHERLQGIEKGRQEGQSFAYTADSIARACMEPNSNSVHVSTDKWESEKKQKYCLRIFDSLHGEFKKTVKLVSEARNHLEFESKDEYGKKFVSSVDFLACRPPRGADKGAIYLHEGAHMVNITEILKAAKGCTAHSGYIRMCGTHQGSGTEFYRIIHNAPDDFGRHPHSNWTVGSFPWWTFPGFCLDVTSAMKNAKEMTTEERVERYGNWILKDLFYSYALEDFQEEFECECLDERHSFFPDFLIKACQPQSEGLISTYWFEKCECDGKKADPLGEAKTLIDFLAKVIQGNIIRGEWMYAMDIGRKKDTDEIIIGNIEPVTGRLCIRALITMSDMPFHYKEQMLHYLLKELPVTKGFIDATGMGIQLAENFHTTYRYGQRAMPMIFNNDIKSRMANELKIKMQQGLLALPIYPALTKQIHAIKKDVTINGHDTYNVEANREHHGDKFWALAMLSALTMNTVGGVTFMPTVAPRIATPELGEYRNNPDLGLAYGELNLPSPEQLWERGRAWRG